MYILYVVCFLVVSGLAEMVLTVMFESNFTFFLMV